MTIHHRTAVEADPNGVVKGEVNSLGWCIGIIETVPIKITPAIYRRVYGDTSIFTKNLNSEENRTCEVLISHY